jgi:hypothetical protein
MRRVTAAEFGKIPYTLGVDGNSDYYGLGHDPTGLPRFHVGPIDQRSYTTNRDTIYLVLSACPARQ